MKNNEYIKELQSEIFVSPAYTAVGTGYGVGHSSPLGACVAATEYYRTTNIGGIIHIMFLGILQKENKEDANKYAENVITYFLFEINRLRTSKSNIDICFVRGIMF